MLAPAAGAALRTVAQAQTGPGRINYQHGSPSALYSRYNGPLSDVFAGNITAFISDDPSLALVADLSKKP